LQIQSAWLGDLERGHPCFYVVSIIISYLENRLGQENSLGCLKERAVIDQKMSGGSLVSFAKEYRFLAARSERSCSLVITGESQCPNTSPKGTA
jgi:hypothetical protein